MNVIASAFAFREDYGNSMQLTEKSDAEKINLYMKNIVVSLVSAKLKNPEDEVLLVTNRTIDNHYQSQLEAMKIKIVQVPFDKYEMPKKFAWSLAFYKLCALEYLSSQSDYEKILLIDSDTISMQSFGELWKEAENGLLLYSINHSYNHKDRNDIREDYQKLYPDEKRNIVHYGGEFICAERNELQDFMKICNSVYERIKERDFQVKEILGDEAIISIAAALYKEKSMIIDAGAYVYRYWTDDIFYLVSTNTVSNPVCVWHLPAEKDRGLLLLYNYFGKNNGFPETDKVLKILGLPKAKRPINIYNLMGRLQRKKSYLRSKK